MSLYSKIWISKWEPIGPAPILREGGSIWHVTGRIEATAPHPTNANVVYAAGACGRDATVGPFVVGTDVK